ncbi:MAG: deoxyribodipyrimidine photo-lyase [Chitinophagales bacterium]
MSTAVFWFRRDLSLDDNVGLYHCLKNHDAVIPIFVFDENILSDLRNQSLQYTLDKRLIFIYDALMKMNDELKKNGSAIQLYHGTPLTVFQKIIQNHTKIDAVYTNHDYEPYAIQRDKQITELLKSKNIAFYSYKNQVIFEKGEVLKEDNSLYKVFTPYSNKWKATLLQTDIKIYDISQFKHKFNSLSNNSTLVLQNVGFQYFKINFSSTLINDNILIDYVKQRDFPAINGTSNLSVHLRFGTISIRKLLNHALEIKANTFI